MGKVNITCYNKTEKMERNKAKQFYSEAIYGCDLSSSECDRYRSILYGLENGYVTVNDNWDY